MNVPVVVQIARMMMTHMATDGPESQSHSDRPKICPCAQPGLSPAPNRPRNRWSRPRESLNHWGPSMPKNLRSPLTAPVLEKRNRNTVEMAIELVTDGK